MSPDASSPRPSCDPRCSGARARRTRARRGHTLVELMMSLLITGIVMTAVASAIVLASRALPDRSSSGTALIELSAAQNRLASELAYAKSVTELSGTAITFTVADRDADGHDEIVRYAWSGKPGEPVTRAYNGKVGTLMHGVKEFRLDYVRRRVPPPPTYTEGPEVLLFGYDAATSLADHSTESLNWIGQYIRPAMSSDAVSWRVTRLALKAKSRGRAIGETRVQVRSADLLNLPGPVIYDQVSMMEDTLASSYEWREFQLTQVDPIPASQGACITFQWISDVHACQIQYRSSGAPGGLVRTATGGTLWLAGGDERVLLQVWGRITTEDPLVMQDLLEEVRITMRAMPLMDQQESSRATSASVVLVNAPQVPAS